MCKRFEYFATFVFHNFGYSTWLDNADFHSFPENDHSFEFEWIAGQSAKTDGRRLSDAAHESVAVDG